MSVVCLEVQNQPVLKSFSLKKILTLPTVWWQRSIMRHQLSELPDYRLQDMGISLEEARFEAQKPFWQK